VCSSDLNPGHVTGSKSVSWDYWRFAARRDGPYLPHDPRLYQCPFYDHVRKHDHFWKPGLDGNGNTGYAQNGQFQLLEREAMNVSTH